MMAEFAYNNFKNTNTDYKLFEFNYSYYHHIFYKNKSNTYFRSISTKRLTIKLVELMDIYCQNLLYT